MRIQVLAPSRFSWMSLILLLGWTLASLLLCLQGSEAAETGSSNSNKNHLEPVVLTSRNYGGHTSDGNVWLVEIYAPWCGHCVSFEPTYKEIAEAYHRSTGSDDDDALDEEKKKKSGIKVGKINGDAEQALVSRFGVKSYPSFFVVDGFSVYEFDGSRSKATLMQYVEGGYKKTSPIPWYQSPNGPLGIAQGLILQGGYRLADVFYWLQGTFGLSAVFAGMVMFGTLFIGMFIMLVALAIFFTPKEKIN